MKNSVFDLNEQHQDLSSKTIAGLERISQVFKVLLWEKAKTLGLSPIQIQLLIFIAHHKSSLNNVSLLAKEFNLTKPTISDAIKVLHQKGLIIKETSAEDSRSYTIYLSDKGRTTVNDAQNFANPMVDIFDGFTKDEKTGFFSTLSKLIDKLNRREILNVQRICFACKFYTTKGAGHYCNFLEKPLGASEIRLDCPEFEAISG